MRYVSTRGGSPALGFADVLLAGLAPDGGLYVPESWPALPPLEELAGPTWTPPAAAAWRSNLEEIARIMATAPPVVV